MLDENDRRAYLKRLRTPGMDNLTRERVVKAINTRCRKHNNCPHCGALNGTVKKVGALKITHDLFKRDSKKNEKLKVDFEKTFAESIKTMPEIKSHINKAQDDMNPLKVLKLFQRISPEVSSSSNVYPHLAHFFLGLPN
jgi:DNA-directed RNA polymerase III subunit RPC1